MRLIAGASVQAAQDVWQPLDRIPPDRQALPPWVRPPRGRPFLLRHAALQAVLARPQPAELLLPLPDGTLARFSFVEAPVMSPELARRFPRIRTYVGQGLDDPSASVRFDWTPAGFHAQILSPHGAVYIDPYSRNDTEIYTSHFKRDYRREADGFICLTEPLATAARPAGGEALRSGPTLHTYRLACAATGEYTQFHGGTVEAGLAAIVTTVNRVTGIYEAEAAIRLVLLTGDSILFYGSNPIPAEYDGKDPRILFEQPENQVPVMDFRYNNLTFYFTSPYYDHASGNLFSWFLLRLIG